MSPLAIQAQNDVLNRVQHGTASTLHLPRPRPRPRARPHPRRYPHPFPHPRRHLTAPPPPLFLTKSTAALLNHLCIIEQRPVRRPHAGLEQRVAPRRDVGRRKASRGGVLRPRPAPGARPYVTSTELAASDAAARQNCPALTTQLPGAPRSSK